MRRLSFPAVIMVAGTIVVTGCGSGKNVQNPRSQLDFGVKAARIGLWREARFRFEKAVALDPASAEALNNLAVAYEGTGEFEKAKQIYLRALNREPTGDEAGIAQRLLGPDAQVENIQDLLWSIMVLPEFQVIY